MHKVSMLNVGDSVRICGYRQAGPHVNHLKAIGLVPGTVMTVQRTAPLGDPIEFRIRGYSLALRKSECDAIEFSTLGDE